MPTSHGAGEGSSRGAPGRGQSSAHGSGASRRPPHLWFPPRAGSKRSVGASSSGSADSSRRAAEKLASFISDAGGCIIQNDLSIFYERHPHLKKYIQGGLTHFCKKHNDLVQFSLPKQSITSSFTPNFVVSDVTDRDVAKWLAAFVAKRGGRMSAAQLTQFYYRHPSARKIMHGKVAYFCNAHSGYLRFERNGGAGIIHSPAQRKGTAAQQDPYAAGAAAAAEAETNDEGAEPPEDLPSAEQEGGAAAEDSQRAEEPREESACSGARKRSRSEDSDARSRTTRVRRQGGAPGSSRGGSEVGHPLGGSASTEARRDEDARSMPPQSRTTRVCRQGGTPGSSRGGDEVGHPPGSLDVHQPDAGTFSGTLGHAKASMQHCQAAFLALEGQLEAEAARAADLERRLEARERRLEAQEHQCEAVREKLAAKEVQLEQAGIRAEDQEVKESLLGARQGYCERLGAQLAEREAALAETEARLREKEAHLDRRKSRHHAERTKLASTKAELEKSLALIADREAAVLAREQECDAREAQLRDREDGLEEACAGRQDAPAGLQASPPSQEGIGCVEGQEEQEEQEDYEPTEDDLSSTADLAVA